jgi:predicted ATPase
LGYPEHAAQLTHQALLLAQELGDVYSHVVALFNAAMLAVFRREGPAAQERAETALALATEHGFAYWRAGGTLVRGWALAEQGHIAAGITQMQQGLQAWRATGAAVTVTTFLTMLAAVHGQAGELADAHNLLREAQTLVDRQGERYWQAEIYRLQGQSLLAQALPDTPQAETCFQQALDIARRQEAKSLELRAAVSLSRLWQQQGKRTKARKLLAPIYGWFTEGFDTADLQEAEALLAALEG